MADRDQRVRLAAFAFLERLRQAHGETLPYAQLLAGFDFEGRRVPLLAPQGIFKPAILDAPLSITTTPPSTRKPRPYADEFGSDGLLRYKYRGSDPTHRDNVGLREVMRLQRPLVYFHGIVEARYMASWPVYIVGDDPGSLTFTVAVDEQQIALPTSVRDPVHGEFQNAEEISDSPRTRAGLGSPSWLDQTGVPYVRVEIDSA